MPAQKAWVAELVDARDVKSLGGFLRAGSIPALGTKIKTGYLGDRIACFA